MVKTPDHIKIELTGKVFTFSANAMNEWSVIMGNEQVGSDLIGSVFTVQNCTVQNSKAVSDTQEVVQKNNNKNEIKKKCATKPVKA